MTVPAVDVWARVAARRVELADRIDTLDPAELDAESWCAGWRVRDVIGHLVQLAEATQRSMAMVLLRNGLPLDRGLAAAARRIGDRPADELAARLRRSAGGRFHVVGLPRAVALGEVLVHSEDALRPVGRPLDTGPDEAATVLDVYRRIGRLAFHQPIPDATLVATDTAWTAGRGPEIRGRALDLLLLLANRRQVLGDLTGPGLDTIG
ncbi:MAG: maleylpyruvate isomerase family mycothiol-dependent enzyme [Acidimicrobiales bacterium]